MNGSLVSFADVLVVGGFIAVVAGLWMTVGLGPTLISAGGAVIWMGGKLQR